MSDPIDTIREALAGLGVSADRAAALAALTEVEHQLADVGMVKESWRRDNSEMYDRAVAAETALAEANRERDYWKAWAEQYLDAHQGHDLEAAERRANDLADALRDLQWALDHFLWDGQPFSEWSANVDTPESSPVLRLTGRSSDERRNARPVVGKIRRVLRYATARLSRLVRTYRAQRRTRRPDAGLRRQPCPCCA